jgi:hypothetical protein
LVNSRKLKAIIRKNISFGWGNMTVSLQTKKILMATKIDLAPSHGVTVPPWRPDITHITAAGVFSLGNRNVNRMGYGAMQLAGPGVFGPPKDRHAALAVLREVVARGSTTSTPAISMALTSPTSSFARRFIPIPMTS